MIQFDPRCEVASPPGRPVRLTTDARPVRNRTTIVGMLAWVVTAFALVGCTSGPEVPADPRTPEGNIRPADPLQLIRETAEHEGLYTLAGPWVHMCTPPFLNKKTSQVGNFRSTETQKVLHKLFVQ